MMMPIDGSVHEAATIPEVEEDYFSPDFKEYIRTEQLNCSRFEGDHRHTLGWVFWSQRDPQTRPDNYADLIRHALQKLIFKTKLSHSLVQFWAPTKTSEGRTLLTTQFQPFALGPTYDKLCEYRMGMCREYNNSFYADAECPQEQLGVPGRVFLHQFPESALFVKTHYTLEEYPQRDLALRCGIESSRVVPVFDQSTHACVGVLEIVSPYLLDFALWPEKFFLGQMYEIFQEFGLQCFDGYKHYEMQIRDEACTVAFQELKTVLEMVCNIHKLPLAMTWVPCSTCNDSLQGQLILIDAKVCWHENMVSRIMLDSTDTFIEASKRSHLRTGVVARMVRSSSNILYCSNITQLSFVDHPLAPPARECKFRGWFAIRLQSSYTANNIYVLECLLPYHGNSSEKSLSLILGTMVENFRTFKLASGQELGDLLRVEVMKFRKGQKLHSFKNIQATRLSCDADMVGPSRPLPGEDQEQDPSLNSDLRCEESTARVCNMVTIKAKIPDYYTIKFSLSLSATFVELQQQVAKRLNHLEAGTYRVSYEDEENERTLIACDEDLQEFLHTSRSLGNTTVVVLLEPNQSITNLNPTN